MNISSSLGSTQVSNAIDQGGSAYGTAIAVKIKDQIKQQGQDAEELVDSAKVPDTDDSVGQNLNTYA